MRLVEGAQRSHVLDLLADTTFADGGLNVSNHGGPLEIRTKMVEGLLDTKVTSERGCVVLM